MSAQYESLIKELAQFLESNINEHNLLSELYKLIDENNSKIVVQYHCDFSFYSYGLFFIKYLIVVKLI